MNGTATAAGEARSLSMYFAHTKETITVTYKKDGKYVPEAMAKINHFLRDWRADESTRMDPQLIDLLWELHNELGSQKPIHIISGFRSSKTNKMLKRIGRNVARRSQHITGKAADVYFPDVPLQRLRESALLRESGGVGYYPRSGKYGFVHVDTGRVRHWPRMSEQQLAALFKNKKNRSTPKRESPLMVARAERAQVPLPRLNPRDEEETPASASPVLVASNDATQENVPVPRSKPFFLAQDVVAIPVSAPRQHPDEPALEQQDSTGSMALARIDSLVLPPPIPTALEINAPTPNATHGPGLDGPAHSPVLMSSLDEPARPTLSVRSLKKTKPAIVASVAPTAPMLPTPRPAASGEKRSLFPLPILRRVPAVQKVASLSPDALTGDRSDVTASIGRTAAVNGLLAIRRVGKGDLLSSGPAVKFAVIELSGNRHMVINRTNKGNYLGNRRAENAASGQRMAAATAPVEASAPVIEELAGGPGAIPAVASATASVASQAIPTPRLRPRTETNPGGMLISSIRQLFR